MYRHEDRPVARRGASAFTLCLQPQHRREGESTSSSSVCLLPSLLPRYDAENVQQLSLQ